MKLKIQMLNGKSYELPLNGQSDVTITSESITYTQYWKEGRQPLNVPEKYWLDEIETLGFEEI